MPFLSSPAPFFLSTASDARARVRSFSRVARADSARPFSFSLSDPWEHVLWTGGGVWAANAMAEWEVKLPEEVKAMQAERQAANARFMESIKSSKE